VAGDAYIVMRGDDGELRAFANVCRHHAARLKPNGCGVVENGKLIVRRALMHCRGRAIEQQAGG